MARRCSRVFLIGLAGMLLASGVLLIGRERAARRVEILDYAPLTGEADWQGDWVLSARGADPSQAGSLAGTDRVTIPFAGTGLALRVRRGSYRAYFWVRIDGEPANRLPRTGRGAYLVLSSPDYEPQVETIPVATGLEDGSHTAEIIADRGWDQWPLAGWRVARGPETAAYDRGLAALAAGAATCLVALIACVGGGRRSRGTRVPSDYPGGGLRREEREVQVSGFGPWRWIVRSPDSTLQILAPMLIAAFVFYVSPWLPLTLFGGVVLAGLIVLRLDLGLALVAASAPFYMHPRPLLGKSFSMAEILILLCLASWALRQVAKYRSTRIHLSLSSPDLAVLSFAVVAAASMAFADHRHVALRELRVVILEPVLYYVMVRTAELNDRAIWRIVDGFVAGAAAVALIGLIQYALGINVITAEQGSLRLRSVYGSPNNAALFLGRGLPILLAGAAFARERRRRLVYGVIAFPVALAMLLSFSRAAIILALPSSLLALALLAGGRWRWIALALLVTAAIGIVPLLSTPRFAGLLDPHSGTLFFRLQLWRSSWKMFRDHPWLGVGPDNFLYQYRGRYILPSAWQEPHLSHAHNIVLTYATRMGIVGLAVGLWLHTAFWREGWALCRGEVRLAAPIRDRRALALGLMGSMVYGLAHGLVDASTFLVDLSIAFLLGLGLVQCIERI